MGKYVLANVLVILLINLGTLLPSLACPYCPNPTPPKHPKPPVVKPPHHPKPPIVKPPKPPAVKPPPYVPKPPPYVPKPPPVEPTPPVVQPPPIVPKPPPSPQTCPIDILKLSACVDVLGGLIHIGAGSSAKDTCCPVLQGLVDLDAALCLCTTIKAKLLNINIILPIALGVLVDCGKHPPSDYQCPALLPD
ncbi:hypothetical protein EZV62_015555 [Acer yangbiense]|uniref:Bifunctional inhibitor/plant lipid transfer protein/seed storage helical domain-containing protein n=1 Tax=Acer yangbiense TaxID=1000413 RepID=A0A5C7HN43_9ROSI|nr:hypothetical protein EZV62_015555 [Acer yangbiense]